MTPASKSTFVLGHRHLLGIEGLSAADITGLLDLSEEYVELNRQVDKKRTSLRGRTQVNLFFEASKNRFTWVRPRREVRFLSTWRLSSTYSSERSSKPVISAAESPSIPSRCRCPRTKVDFDAGVIKARAIGRDATQGKRQIRRPDLSTSASAAG